MGHMLTDYVMHGNGLFYYILKASFDGTVALTYTTSMWATLASVLEIQRAVSGQAHPYLSELRRDFLASIGITYAVFRIAKSRLRAFGAFY